MNHPQNLLATPSYGAHHPQPVGPVRSGTEYRMPEHQHLAQHYGQDRTSAQLAQELGRTPGALRTHVSRHPELRPSKH
jgi:hypothetical protein